MSDIHIRLAGQAGRITLQRPEALNAITYEMCSAIEDALERWRDDPLVKLIVIDALGIAPFARAVILPIFTPLGQQVILALAKHFGPTNIG